MSLRLPTVTEFKLLKKFAEYYRLYQKDHSRDQSFSADFRDFEDICAAVGIAIKTRPNGEIEVPSSEGKIALNEKENEDNYNILSSLFIEQLEDSRYGPKRKEKLLAAFQEKLLDGLHLPRTFIKPRKTIPWRRRKEFKKKAKKVNPKILKAGLAVFGEKELFDRWLRVKVKIFGRKMPLDVIQTKEGVEKVVKVLSKLAGVAPKKN